jgi:actin-related protein
MGAFYQGDYVGAIVADIGAYSTKIGYAGDDYPKSYFRSVRQCVCCETDDQEMMPAHIWTTRRL